MPRFVILEHSWEGIHWDVMLECGQALRTWAVDAPVVPGVELLARPLADHRLEYLSYEGPISRNRGTVRRVAEGRYIPRLWEPSRIVVELSGLQLAGVLDLRTSETGRSPEFRPLWTLRFRGKVV